ncbi:hypothetical protein HYH03_010877 [Edaphochlamys debaryana]|uniref:Glycosyltransferase n=1 Tax=Edaphochlamys debaryana TaxID=47281 RepID=A0A836BVJ9_9CHLO|nr:hypothetical protein HYH03_010877 [Edaphochlamys debaryana]|eukprot:KAG2490721.1 hypothetical protein HYH03_010877 [Edaphochlamys debaryana]
MRKDGSVGLSSQHFEHAFEGNDLWHTFLQSLRNITFVGAGGRQDHLAAHLLAAVLTLPNNTAASCSRHSAALGAHCAAVRSPMFTPHDAYGYMTLPSFALSFAKILTLANVLSAGADVLFLDCDQVLFKNPLPYLLERDMDVQLTGGGCFAREDDKPDPGFPSNDINIGFVYLRAVPMAIRAMTDWLHIVVHRARRGSPTMDQPAFHIMFEDLLADGLMPKYITGTILRSELFPQYCNGPCGCNTKGKKLGQKGNAERRDKASGMCRTEAVRNWYNFHVPCSGDLNKKAQILVDFVAMYDKAIGPVGSRSDPMHVVGGPLPPSQPPPAAVTKGRALAGLASEGAAGADSAGSWSRRSRLGL